MTDFYLKFENKEQADSVLYTVTDEVTDAEGVVVQEASSKPNFANIDVIGTIYKPTEAVDEEGNPVMEALTGYHINIRAVDGEDTSAIAPFAVVPSVPVRIWG
jgi:hypothetical protein